jgi:hypothetical protein
MPLLPISMQHGGKIDMQPSYIDLILQLDATKTRRSRLFVSRVFVSRVFVSRVFVSRVFVSRVLVSRPLDCASDLAIYLSRLLFYDFGPGMKSKDLPCSPSLFRPKQI